jgi:uncharacterized protein (DUF924 family)
MDEREPAWVAEVLDFWFGELGPRQWFAQDAALGRESTPEERAALAQPGNSF